MCRDILTVAISQGKDRIVSTPTSGTHVVVSKGVSTGIRRKGLLDRKASGFTGILGNHVRFATTALPIRIAAVAAFTFSTIKADGGGNITWVQGHSCIMARKIGTANHDS